MGDEMSFDRMVQEVESGLSVQTWRNCKDCGAPDDLFEWYYAEDRLYVIRNRKMKGYYFVYAKSPADAWEKLRKRYLYQNRKTGEV